MSFPLLFQYKVMSTLKDLSASFDLLRAIVTRIRRLRCFSSIPSATGSFHAEPLLTNRNVWTVHLHLVVDCADVVEDDDFDDWVATVNAEFKRLTNQRGTFSVAPEPLVDIPARMARYMCKPEACSPPPGKLLPAELYMLLRALHGRQLLVHWGSTARGRRFKRAA